MSARACCMALAILIGGLSTSALAAGRCAYVDVAIFDSSEPKRQCFSLEMSCGPHEKYGCFKGSLNLKDGWVDGGKSGRLRELKDQFGYIDPQGMHWDVPAGFQTDGASIPLFFRPAIGGPWTENYVKAAIIHDFYIRRRTVSADAVHRVFYFALLAAGNSERRSQNMWFAVANFGPKWKHVDVAAYDQAWQARKAMLDQVLKWHKDMWDAFQESERQREEQQQRDRAVLSRPLPQRTKVFTLRRPEHALEELDVFIETAIQDDILHRDRDATLVKLLREQVEEQTVRSESERENVFVVQFTSLGATTTRFAARNDAELQTQLNLVDQLTRVQEEATDRPFEACVGECAEARQNGPRPLPPAPRLGP